MPFKPVISINVDDEQFRDFVKIFDSYQSKLKDTDSEWSKAARTMNHGFGDTASSKLHEFADTLSGMNPSIRGIGSGLIGLTRHMGIFGGAIHVAASGAGMLARTIKGIVGDVTKLALMGAGGIFAFDRLASSGVNMIGNARAINTSAGRLSAFKIGAAGVAPANLPESISSAMANPASIALSQMVLQRAQLTSSQALQHPVAASMAVIQQAHDFFARHRNEIGSPQFWQTSPMMQAFRSLGLSQADVFRIGNTSQRDLDLTRQTINRDSARLQMPVGTMRELREFRIDLDLAGRTIEVDLINRLRTLGPSLGGVISSLTSRFVELVNDVLTKPHIDAFRDFLDRVTAFVDSPAFGADLKKLESGIADAASDIVSIAKWLGAIVKSIPGTAPHGRTPGTGLMGGKTPAQNFHANMSDLAARQAVEREFGGGSILWTLGHSINDTGRMIMQSPSVSAAERSAEVANGLPAGTLSADAFAESGNNAFARNGNARGAFQMLPAAVARYLHGGNPLDPLVASRGEAAQLAQNLATARALLPIGTLMQHLELMKAANAIGDQGLIRAFDEASSRGQSSDWMKFIPTWARQDVVRFMSHLPNRSALESANAAGQIDTGVSSTSDRRQAASDLAAVARNTSRLVAQTSSPRRVVYKAQTDVQSDLSQQAYAAAAVGGTP